MIIDEVLENKGIARNIREHIGVLRRHAHKFVFDADASKLLGKFSVQCSDLVLAHRQFAKAPYDVTYIEVDWSWFYQKELDSTAPPRLGFLYDHGDVYTLLGYEGMGTLSPLMLYLGERGKRDVPKHKFQRVDFKTIFGEKSALQAKIGYITGMKDLDRNLGVTIPAGTPLPASDDILEYAVSAVETELADLYFDNEVYWLSERTLENLTEFPDEEKRRALREFSGDGRNIWAILLWLNSVPRSIQYIPQPMGARLFKGKRMVLSSHNTVHIHLKGKPDIRKVYLKSTHKRDTPRRHDVRGTWCHAQGQAKGCGHEWPALPDHDKVYKCSKCGRLRWWRNSHERGDASKGFVDKHYQAEI